MNEANHHLFYQDHPNNIPKIAFNVWETTRYEDSFFKKLLEFDQLWLPSEWAKQCVIEQGYPEEKVQIVTEGVDGQTFYPKKVEESDRFKFIIFGRWDYRKCTKELIQTFLNTFGMDEKVDLIISVDNPFSIDGLEDDTNQVYRKNVNTKKAIDNMISFASERQKYKTKKMKKTLFNPSWQFLVFDHNFFEIPDVLKLAWDNNISVQIKINQACNFLRLQFI